MILREVQPEALDPLPVFSNEGTDKLALMLTDPANFVLPCWRLDTDVLADATERAIEIMTVSYPVFVIGHTVFRSSVN